MGVLFGLITGVLIFVIVSVIGWTRGVT